MALSTSGKESNNSVTVHCGNEIHADLNVAINIRDNCITGSGNPGRLQAICHIQVNRRLSLWTKRSRPSLRLVLKVVDLLPHGEHPQQKDDCPLRWNNSIHGFVDCAI